MVDGSVINREFAEQGQDDLTRGRAAINYRLGSKTTLSLTHEYTNQDPGETGTTREYTANITSLFVTFAMRED